MFLCLAGEVRANAAHRSPPRPGDAAAAGAALAAAAQKPKLGSILNSGRSGAVALRPPAGLQVPDGCWGRAGRAPPGLAQPLVLFGASPPSRDARFGQMLRSSHRCSHFPPPPPPQKPQHSLSPALGVEQQGFGKDKRAPPSPLQCVVISAHSSAGSVTWESCSGPGVVRSRVPGGLRLWVRRWLKKKPGPLPPSLVTPPLPWQNQTRPHCGGERAEAAGLVAAAALAAPVPFASRSPSPNASAPTLARGPAPSPCACRHPGGLRHTAQGAVKPRPRKRCHRPCPVLPDRPKAAVETNPALRHHSVREETLFLPTAL